MANSKKTSTLPLTDAMTVLVVDDDKSSRHVAAQTIRGMGVNVIECEDGKEAHDCLKRQDVDAVVSDLMMPRMSGMMLLHTMLEEGLQIPFIFATGFSDKDSAIQALRLGAFDYLEKPYDVFDLTGIVTEALRVSREQKELIKVVRGKRPAESRDTELQIMKMRTFRFQSETTDLPVSEGKQLSWSQLRDLFVKEAEPQLVFCESAIKGLSSSSEAAQELAFLQRVVQSVRMAGEALRVSDIAELAWALENGLASVKTSGRSISADQTQLFDTAVKALRAKVAALSDPEIAKLEKDLETMAYLLRSAKTG